MLKFTKMHGIGNDYVYFDCFTQQINDPERLAVFASDRRFGVGGDGIVLIMPSDKADFRMRMFNIDGSEGRMCGNATRCIGKYVYERHLTDKTTVTLETLSGIKTLRLHLNANGLVESVDVDMGQAILTPREIPVDMDGERCVDYPLMTAAGEYKLTCVSMGNPHAVIFIDDDPMDIPLESVGPQIERHPFFPERVNTEFVRVLDETTLKMRVWERGSGETLACGTGACASAVAAVLKGYCRRDTDITLKLRGGELIIRWLRDGRVMMSGPATMVFDGELDWQ